MIDEERVLASMAPNWASELYDLVAAIPSPDTTDPKEIRFLHYVAEDCIRALFQVLNDTGGTTINDSRAACNAFGEAHDTLHDIGNRAIDFNALPYD